MEKITRRKNDQEIRAMREGGAMLAAVLHRAVAVLAAGMTTAELSREAATELKRLGGKPAFLGYLGYPDVLCVSLNDAVVHGIPDQKTEIRTGDIVSLDFGVEWQGLITDAALSVIVGAPSSPRHQELISGTQKALAAGIKAVHAGAQVGDISSAIQNVLEQHGLGIVRDLVGHGVGDELHEAPNIPNFGKAKTGFVLEAGMTIAIEPMATLGNEAVVVDGDGWTVRTRDGSRAAHFEHTVVVAERGAEILTVRDRLPGE